MKAFYRVDTTRITFREHAFDNPWILAVPIFGIIKLLRIQLPFSTDDAAVKTLAPFEVQENELPVEVRKRFGRLSGELEGLGFGQPIYHQIFSPLQDTYLYWATFVHSSGRAVARIHHRVWSRKNMLKSYLFPIFISETADGSFVVTSAGKPDMAAPKSVKIQYKPGATAYLLWRAHTRRLDERQPGRLVDVRSDEDVRHLIERHHEALREFHVERGVFQPIDADEQERLVQSGDAKLSSSTGGSVEDAVLARLERLRTQRPSWTNFVVVLVLSMLAFLAAGLKDMDRGFLWLIVPILLFHELGHYVAMRCFGYRNLRMFFIPFFGAAVAGKHYNVPGWKKAVVALAGPIPGIYAGAALGIVGTTLALPKLSEVASLMLIVNALNLLPFLPLDGGWVLHAVLFCRHPLLDLAFRLVAILAFFGLALLIGGHIYLLGIVMLVGLPAAWHVANVAERLRNRDAIAVSPDDVSIPETAARTILGELGAGKHARTPANLLAQQVTSVFETLNARPPGVPASLTLLAAQGSSFVMAFVLTIVFVVARHGLHLPGRFAPRETPPQYTYTPGNTDVRAYKAMSFLADADSTGKPGAAALPKVVTLAATYRDEEAARKQFQELTARDLNAEFGSGVSLTLFGQSVLASLPARDDLDQALEGSARRHNQERGLRLTERRRHIPLYLRTARRRGGRTTCAGIAGILRLRSTGFARAALGPGLQNRVPGTTAALDEGPTYPGSIDGNRPARLRTAGSEGGRRRAHSNRPAPGPRKTQRITRSPF